MKRNEYLKNLTINRVFLTEEEAASYGENFVKNHIGGYAFYYRELVKPKTLFKPAQYQYQSICGIKPLQKKEVKQHLWRKRINKEK